jgi:type III secretory pathway component EscS
VVPTLISLGAVIVASYVGFWIGNIIQARRHR